jgi:hypothetical protein
MSFVNFKCRNAESVSRQPVRLRRMFWAAQSTTTRGNRKVAQPRCDCFPSKSIWKYQELLPLESEPKIGHGTGGTPLIRAGASTEARN